MNIIDLINSAENILVTSHSYSTDIDAFASSLFVYNMIRHNFPKKNVAIAIETQDTQNLTYMTGYKNIEYTGMLKKIGSLKPDLIIMTDVHTLNGITNNNDEKVAIAELVAKLGTKVAVFDHHPKGQVEYDLYVHENRYSACDVVYTNLVDELGLKLYTGWEETILAGILTDSKRFFYDHPLPKTFKIVEKALESGKTTIEEVENKVYSYTKQQLLIVSELLKNMHEKDIYNYSFMTWDFFDSVLKEGFVKGDYVVARRIFSDDFMLRLGRKSLGFSIYPDTDSMDHRSYHGSIRSLTKTYYCPAFAKYLNGGGHGTGTGFSIKADSMEDAVKMVEKVIAEHIDEAGWPEDWK